MFEKLKNVQEEREIQEKIRKIEGFAEEVLQFLRNKDITLAETAMIIKATNDLLNKRGSALKLSAII